jgi:hypothetical protein
MIPLHKEFIWISNGVYNQVSQSLSLQHTMFRPFIADERCWKYRFFCLSSFCNYSYFSSAWDF